MANPTDEYMLPISFGLLDHLPRMGCDPCALYLWLHFKKIHKGEKKGTVTFICQDISDFFNVSRATVTRNLLHLVKINLIEWDRGKNQHGFNVVKILKNKSIEDFSQMRCFKNGTADAKSRSKNETAPTKFETADPFCRSKNETAPTKFETADCGNPDEQRECARPKDGKEELIIKEGKDINSPVIKNKKPKSENQIPVPEEIPFTPEFIEFWKIYPRPIDKAEAFKCWSKRVDEGFAPEKMLLAAAHYAEECRLLEQVMRFMKHPSTFLGSTIRFARPFTFEGYIEWTPPKVSAATPEKRKPGAPLSKAEYDAQFATFKGEESRF